jgi:hypothetical protein
VASSINNNQGILNWVIGGIFALTALIQLYKIYSRKDVQHNIEHPEELEKKFEDQFDEFNKT